MDARRIITPGFGSRLKQERLRLGYSQTQLAERAGIKRLTQAQYEAEVTHPSIPYLSRVAEAGVDLAYLLFGDEGGAPASREEDERQMERQAFLLVEEIVAARPDDSFSAEDRHVLFEVIRHRLRTLLSPDLAAEEPARATGRANGTAGE